MVRSIVKRPTNIEKENTGLAWRWGLFALATPSPRRDERQNMSPKAHTSFTPQKINTNQHIQLNQTNTEVTKMVWRPERNKFRGSGACTKGQGTIYLYPTNTWEVGHGSRLSEGVIWWWGEKKRLFWGFRLSFLRRDVLLDGISPKRGKYGLGPVDACHRGR